MSNPAIIIGFRGDYCPGGRTTRSKRRENARRNGRKGGLASGRKRRQLARGKRARPRSRQSALALAYRQRQLKREQFETLYRRTYPTGNAGGLETLWQHYLSCFTVYRAEGQHFRTTNLQRECALANRARIRCRRTIQRLNRRLEEMGLAAVMHYRDQGATPGRKDCLVVEIRTPARDKNVTPPLRGSTNPPYGRAVGAVAPQNETERSSGNDSSPPPAAADDIGAPAGANDQAPGEEDGVDAAFKAHAHELAGEWDRIFAERARRGAGDVHGHVQRGGAGTTRLGRGGLGIPEDGGRVLPSGGGSAGDGLGTAGTSVGGDEVGGSGVRGS